MPKVNLTAYGLLLASSFCCSFCVLMKAHLVPIMAQVQTKLKSEYFQLQQSTSSIIINMTKVHSVKPFT